MCENRHILALCEQKLCVHPSIIMLQFLRAMAFSDSSRSPCSQLKLQPASILFWCFTINYKVEQSSAQVTSSSAFNLSLTQPPNSEMTHFRCCQILRLPNLPWLPMMAYLFPSCGVGVYFNLLPGFEWSAIMLSYDFPLAIIGMTLKMKSVLPDMISLSK